MHEKLLVGNIPIRTISSKNLIVKRKRPDSGLMVVPTPKSITTPKQFSEAMKPEIDNRNIVMLVRDVKEAGS